MKPAINTPVEESYQNSLQCISIATNTMCAGDTFKYARGKIIPGFENGVILLWERSCTLNTFPPPPFKEKAVSLGLSVYG